MKNISKRFIAATLAGCLSLGSTIGAFAVSRTPSPIEDGDQRRIIASFVHGSEYVNSGGTDGAGYNFAMSGLPNGGSVKAGNFIKLYALDPSVNVTNNTVGATIEGDSLYCLCPNQPVNVNYGTGYLATAHTESELDGNLSPYLPVSLTEYGISNLRKAVAVTYVASIGLKWQYVAHHGQNEWVEFSFPYADYPKNLQQTTQDITENKVACQILVWMAAMGWLDKNNPDYERTALDIFLKEMYAKYPDEAANIEALYWRYKADYDSLGKTYDDIVGMYGIEAYMKKNPAGYTPVSYDGAYSVFEIPVTSKDIDDHFDITRAIIESLRKQGLKVGDYKVRYKNQRIIEVMISTTIPQNSFEIEVNTTHLRGNSPYASKYFKELVILDGGTQQNLVSLTPKTGTFKLVREAAPIEMKLVKTFEGVNATNAGIDTSKFAFALWDAGKKRFLNFDSKDGVYTHNGKTARDSNSATPLLLNARGEIKLDNIPSDGEYYFIETRALANWSKMLNKPIPYEPDGTGTFVFDNHGEGTGLLLFDKLFFNENGFVQYTKDSTGVEKERYNEGIANLTFTIIDSTGASVGVTGSNGAYTYSENGGGGEMKLDSNGRLYVDKLPTGVYYIEETLAGKWLGENGEREGETVRSSLINVALNEASSLEERIEKAQALDSMGSLSNYYDLTYFRLQIVKESENGKVEGFEFTVTNSNGDVCGVMITDEKGEAYIEELPMYKEDGVTLETYTLTEMRKLPYDELAPVEFTGIPGEDVRYLTAEEGIYNQFTRRNLGVVKKSEDGIVSGIEFTINAIDPDTNKTVETYTVVTEELAKGTYNGSDPIGYGELLGLPVYNAAGTAQLIYEVTENVPLRYEDVAPQQTVLEDEVPLTEVVFENKVKYTDLYIMKWADDYKVEGLEFMCVGDDGNTYTATSAATGLVTFRDLPVYNEYDRKIRYSVFEINTPERYYEPEGIEDITLYERANATKNYYEIDNNSKYGELTITKVDGDNKKLSGASFILYSAADYDANGEAARAVSAKTSDGTGTVTFKKLSVNKEYVVVEAIAPAGYQKTEEPYRFTVTDADEATEYKIGYTWVNTAPKTLEVLKLDEDTNDELMGAIFTLYTDNGEEFPMAISKITGKDGKATFNDLAIGRYRLVEDKAPIGYQLPADHEWSITITEDSDNVIQYTVTNKGEVPAGVTIYKSDEETGVPLAGAVFELYTNIGEGATAKRTLYGTATSDKDGIAKFENLPNGKYTLTEKTAPNGYQVTDEAFSFEVTDDNKAFSYSMTNAKSASFSIKIEKIDSKTKDAIANATFALYNKTDNRYIYNDVKTNANGMITFDKDIQFGKEFDSSIGSQLQENLQWVTEHKSCLWVDSFKMLSRNIEKLLSVIEYLLINDCSFATANYFIANGYAEKRNSILKAASSQNAEKDMYEHFSNLTGVGEIHARYLRAYLQG